MRFNTNEKEAEEVAIEIIVGEKDSELIVRLKEILKKDSQ